MAIDRIERLPIDQNGYQKNRIAIDRTEIENIYKEIKYVYISKLNKNLIYVAKTRNYNIYATLTNAKHATSISHLAPSLVNSDMRGQIVRW